MSHIGIIKFSNEFFYSIINPHCPIFGQNLYFESMKGLIVLKAEYIESEEMFIQTVIDPLKTKLEFGIAEYTILFSTDENGLGTFEFKKVNNV